MRKLSLSSLPVALTCLASAGDAARAERQRVGGVDPIHRLELRNGLLAGRFGCCRQHQRCVRNVPLDASDRSRSARPSDGAGSRHRRGFAGYLVGWNENLRHDPERFRNASNLGQVDSRNRLATARPISCEQRPSGANVGSAWGLSGDGNKLVGLYWINNGGRAQAAQGTVAAGVTSLGTTTLSSRASATNYDGSVVVGFEAASGGFPSRTPTVWANGVTTKLEPAPLVDCELTSVNADGTIVAGNFREGIATTRDATIWRFTSGTWVRQVLGITSRHASGHAWIDDLRADR